MKKFKFLLQCRDDFGTWWAAIDMDELQPDLKREWVVCIWKVKEGYLPLPEWITKKETNVTEA